MNKITLGISSCLLGNNVRYDGGHKLDHFLVDTLGQYVDWIPVCPEAACGLGIPRESMRLVGDPEDPRLVTVRTGKDHTARMKRWAKERTAELAHEGLCGFVFKARSPSSGMRGVKIYNEAGIPYATGSGIFAHAFMKRFPLLPVEDEGRMHDPGIRENFIERVFVYQRWQEYIRKDGSLGGLVAFHTDHKYLIMAHSQKHYSLLGKMVAAGKSARSDKLRADYLETLMEGLQLLATPKKNTNVLQHMAGYFKEQLSAEEKRELLEVITSYHDGLVPLIVPVTLLRHYVRKYQEDYLARQFYLNPHPLELMLRNHV
ncbi:MAG: DUF523 and DUF1722 domain-containing protein [Nitrospirae bacterium]|nr:DUF523 and DUF1722 domain-containing protein [Nitrospirota bacterium]NTW65035.1 DUF523 and DUF1722 domain-containing protein [Nitrospirota bacterium]